MPLLEKSERFVGAAFLGIPALDAFVWVLDNYARLELLVTLHDRLPHFLTNPVTTFICMCIGLMFLYFSHKEQLNRLSEEGTRKIVDSSGATIIRNDESKWLIP